jgi:hypothetical protein
MKARICQNCLHKGTASQEQRDAVIARLKKAGHNWNALCAIKCEFVKNKQAACEAYIEK